ncbi:MAG: ABC transporter ATP-binding protein [Solirubrobacterales bacterium]
MSTTDEPTGATPPRGGSGVLTATGVAMHFEGVKAIDGADLRLDTGQIVGLIGPNGAGKTTFVNVISGFEEPTAGRVEADGVDVTEMSPEKRARLGLVRTFQGSRSFGDLTVYENVEVSSLGLGVKRLEARERATEALRALGIAELAEARAADLTTGQERRLQVARVMAMRPRFLFLDEPAAGLNEGETEELLEVIMGLPGALGCGVLLIDHDMSLIMRACESIVVLDYGKVIAVGPPAAIRTDQRVIDAYLGS